MGYHYHTQDWPVVRFEFIGRLSADEIAAYIADADALVAGGRPYATVMDGSHMLLPEAEFVRRQARWIREHGADMQRLNRGIAFVAQSTVIRGLVRAVMHFQEMPVPYAWFSNLAEAMVWAQERAHTSSP
jgi:hypothetical protein